MGESSHVKAFRAKHLKGDTIKATADGYIGKMMGTGKDAQHNGSLIITNKSVVFYRKGFFGEVHQAIPLDKITSVEQSSMLGHRTIRMHTSHDDLEFKTLQGDRYPALIEAIEAGRNAPAARVAGPTTSALDELKKLGELRAAGLVTDHEFETKKRELLQRV